MAFRIILAGATGRVGRALTAAIEEAPDMDLVAAVSRSGAGRDLGEVLGGAPSGVPVFSSVAEALAVPADVLIDYTDREVIKAATLAAVAAGLHVVIGTSGLAAADFDEIDVLAREKGVGVLGGGNFAITAILLRRFAIEAAKYIADVELIEYCPAERRDAPSGTARELAEELAEVRQPATSWPVEEMVGAVETRGGAFGEGRTEVRLHALRLPSYLLAVEAVFATHDERLTIRHDAGFSPMPYVSGTMLAARKVSGWTGVKRGLDAVMD